VTEALPAQRAGIVAGLTGHMLPREGLGHGFADVPGLGEG
jgi:hypothetical protein